MPEFFLKMCQKLMILLENGANLSQIWEIFKIPRF